MKFQFESLLSGYVSVWMLLGCVFSCSACSMGSKENIEPSGKASVSEMQQYDKAHPQPKPDEPRSIPNMEVPRHDLGSDHGSRSN